MVRNRLSRLFLESPAPDRLSAQDAEIAIAALLVRLARSDERYAESERQRIETVLARRRGLTRSEAAARRVAAEMIEAEAPDTVRFTRTVKERIALDDRMDVIAALWEIAYSDGRRGAEEESLVRLIAGLLGITDRDSALTRQRVLTEMGLRDE
jgi:uncharacterized tellurite resistance protein B-like protein